MKWKRLRHINGNNNESETIIYNLILDFPLDMYETRWNRKDKRPVLELTFVDRKNPAGWWLDKFKGEWFQPKRYKWCRVRFFYFQSLPEVGFGSTKNEKSKSVHPVYEEFDLEYAKNHSMKIFKERLMNVFMQLNSREFLIEKIEK